MVLANLSPRRRWVIILVTSFQNTKLSHAGCEAPVSSKELRMSYTTTIVRDIHVCSGIS